MLARFAKHGKGDNALLLSHTAEVSRRHSSSWWEVRYCDLKLSRGG
jgi:hypothetical protein